MHPLSEDCQHFWTPLSRAFPALETPLNLEKCSMYPPKFGIISQESKEKREKTKKHPLFKEISGGKVKYTPFFTILGPDFVARKVPLYRTCGHSDPGVRGPGFDHEWRTITKTMSDRISIITIYLQLLLLWFQCSFYEKTVQKQRLGLWLCWHCSQNVYNYFQSKDFTRKIRRFVPICSSQLHAVHRSTRLCVWLVSVESSERFFFSGTRSISNFGKIFGGYFFLSFRGSFFLGLIFH